MSLVDKEKDRRDQTEKTMHSRLKRYLNVTLPGKVRKLTLKGCFAKVKNTVFSRKTIPAVVSLVMIAALLLMPTGYEEAQAYKGKERSKVKVLETDDSRIIDTGLVRSGEQICVAEVLNGKFEGEIVQGINLLTGSLEEDKIFKPDDQVLVLISHQNDTVLTVSMVDHYRLDMTAVLAGICMLFLVLFAGRTGFHAILSFILTVLAIWKILIPSFLNGGNPVIISLIIVVLLTAVIISLVYGFDRRSAAAISGSVLGTIATAVMGIITTNAFQIHGAVMAYSESLLYNGYHSLNLTQIFMASIFIGASGALMDLAVDITSAVSEVVEKKPDISKIEAVKSGMNVGKAAMGTMSTTLLLAYSGGYIALLMVFMAQGTPVENILNYKFVSAEILHTIVGSFGLVTVAPFTALTSGILLAGREVKTEEKTAGIGNAGAVQLPKVLKFPKGKDFAVVANWTGLKYQGQQITERRNGDH